MFEKVPEGARLVVDWKWRWARLRLTIPKQHCPTGYQPAQYAGGRPVEDCQYIMYEDHQCQHRMDMSVGSG